jgi:ABC-type cobalamin/Fe3+-siderophores transport system ATPase subunit
MVKTNYLEQIYAAISCRNQGVPNSPFTLKFAEEIGKEGLLKIEGKSLVISNREDGFWGVFRTYAPDDLNDLATDLRALADYCETQRLDRKRPPSVVLFAIIVPGNNPSGPTPEADPFAAQIRSLQRNERLLQSVSISRLCWTEETPDELAHWASRAEKVCVEVERFLAPLLMTVRDTRAKNPDGQFRQTWHDELTNAVDTEMKRLQGCGKGERSQLEEKVHLLLRTELLKLVSHLPSYTAVTEAIRLHELKVKGYRRYLSEATLPFGRLTVLYGPNGTGKSSLIEAVSLALTGKVRRQNGPIANSVVRHPKHTGTDEPLGTLTVTGTSKSEPRTYPLPRQHSEDTLPIGTFYLSQESLRNFLTQTDEERYSWICDMLGLNVGQLQQALHQLEEKLRQSCLDAWQQIVAKPTKATKFEPKRFEQELSKRILDKSRWTELATKISDLRTLANQTKLEEVTKLLGGRFDSIERYIRTAQETEARLAAALEAGDIVEKAVLDRYASNRALVLDHFKELSSFPTGLIRTLERALTVFIAEREAESASLAPLSRSEEDLLDSLLARMERLRQLDFWLERAHQASDAFVKTSATLRDVWFEIQGLERELTSSMAQDVQHFLLRGRELDDLPSALRMHRSQVANRLADLERQAEPLSLRQNRLAHFSSTEPTNADSARGRYHQARQDVQVALRLESLPEEPAELAPLFALAHAIDELIRIQVPGLDPAVLQLLPEYFEPPHQKLETGGLYSRLYTLRLLGEWTEKLTETVQTKVKDLIQSDIGRPVREILWTLTGTNWGHFPVELVVNGEAVELRTKLGKVTDVYNAAEQNLLCLALFFTAYLYEGARFSKAILLDDPFQSLDDINLLSCVRLFDDVASAVGAEQVVMALHQEALARFIYREYSVEQPGGEAYGHDFTTLAVVSASGDDESQLRSTGRNYARPEPLIFKDSR